MERERLCCKERFEVARAGKKRPSVEGPSRVMIINTWLDFTPAVFVF